MDARRAKRAGVYDVVDASALELEEVTSTERRRLRSQLTLCPSHDPRLDELALGDDDGPERVSVVVQLDRSTWWPVDGPRLEVIRRKDQVPTPPERVGVRTSSYAARCEVLSYGDQAQGPQPVLCYLRHGESISSKSIELLRIAGEGENRGNGKPGRVLGRLGDMAHFQARTREPACEAFT
jgi:hypothetical protein